MGVCNGGPYRCSAVCGFGEEDKVAHDVRRLRRFGPHEDGVVVCDVELCEQLWRRAVCGVKGSGATHGRLQAVGLREHSKGVADSPTVLQCAGPGQHIMSFCEGGPLEILESAIHEVGEDRGD
eukprot:gnl/MRDRNA2_/MRDRNA2_49784_c0_seq1.p1 gnl/MRDRNA2_/MRDRNA2_49784_c0~~gnl/MRDRNA2_/MRDRNA2_49784_c0_seq1.p1  ORF type:complete len:123 (-),score=15.45 gnl/MRDRNA2_/MRDRNA2_49784_c0_seq1:198-566(-)